MLLLIADYGYYGLLTLRYAIISVILLMIDIILRAFIIAADYAVIRPSLLL